MNENDNFKEIELKNKIDNEIQNYNENILIPNDDTRLIDKNLLTCENMKSEINILGLETEGLYTPRELEENNFIEENLLAYEESKEITKESTSKNHSQFEYSIEKSVENSNSEMHLKTKPPKHRSNNNSHSSGFNKSSFTNHNYGKLRNDSNRSIKKKELGDSLDNISATSKFKKIDDNSNKINRNLKNKTVTSEKTRNNNSLFDSKIVKRNTNENKSLDKAKSNLGSHKIINHTVSSKFGTPKNQVDQNRRSLELRKNNLDKISVEVKYKNPVINKIPKSNRVKENKDSKLVIFTKDSEKTIANKEFKLDNVISYLEDVFGLNFAENYEKKSNYIKNLDINYQMELEKSMINCIYNQKKKIEQLEEIIKMETDSNSIRENKIKLLTNELTLLKGSIKTIINDVKTTSTKIIPTYSIYNEKNNTKKELFSNINKLPNKNISVEKNKLIPPKSKRSTSSK